MQRSMRGRQREPRRVEHLTDRQVLVIRWTINRSPWRMGPTRKRRQAESLRAHRLVDHSAVDSDRGVAALSGRPERAGDLLGPLPLVLARGEHTVEQLHL